MRKLIVAAVVLFAAAAGVGGAAGLQALVNNKPPSVTVNNGDPVPNMVRPTELHIQNVTLEECNNMGGRYNAKVVLCMNVDY